MCSNQATDSLMWLLDSHPDPRRARDLLDRLGGVSVLMTVNERWLVRTGGLTPKEAKRIRAAFGLSHMALTSDLPAPLTRPQGVLRLLSSLCTRDVEEGWVFTVGSGLRPIGHHRVAQGGAAHCALAPADVLRAVLLDGATGFFLVHNHPSGDPEPSEPDREFTSRLGTAARIMNLRLHDHLVVSRGRWASCLTDARGERPFLNAEPPGAP